MLQPRMLYISRISPIAGNLLEKYQIAFNSNSMRYILHFAFCFCRGNSFCRNINTIPKYITKKLNAILLLL